MAVNKEFTLANRRARSLQSTVPHAVGAHYDHRAGRVVINLSSRLDVSFSPRDAQGLERARPSQLEEIEISPSGFGIHFPKLDADRLCSGAFGGPAGIEALDGVPPRARRRPINKSCEESCCPRERATRRQAEESREGLGGI